MDTPSTPSGLRVREIKTTTITETIDGQSVTRIVPELDANGQEIELAAVEVARDVETHDDPTEREFLVLEDLEKDRATREAAAAQAAPTLTDE